MYLYLVTIKSSSSLFGHEFVHAFIGCLRTVTGRDTVNPTEVQGLLQRNKGRTEVSLKLQYQRITSS